jgi:hypothetical protein
VSLTPGTRVGPFEIVAPLGAGGMGEVYRARDTRLGRDVAVKALPTVFAQDPDRLARFEREAKLLASLSHPNIAGIHGLEEVAGTPYLVLEFVEGETLADRLARGPLPIDEAIDICRQIATGVEAAHESGVVHRDLKPGNVMITPAGAVKVLDFGLAKGGGAAGSGSNVLASASPTMTYAATEVGVVLGTAAYMSPEQARGKSVDRRTDVWSFGCVLFECLTGRQAYEGETVSDLIARILEREPDWNALPPTTPSRVVELIRRCLTKDSTQRLRDMGEARIALAAPGAAAGQAPSAATAHARAARPWLAPAIAAVCAALATAAVVLALRPAAPPGPVRRFRMLIEGFTTKFLAPLAFTRDGTRVAYEAKNHLWIRRLDQLEAFEVPGSENGHTPFWSWDQQTLGFAAGKKLWTCAPGAEQSKVVCDLPESGEMLGAAWGPDGRIIFSAWRGALYEVPAGGGEARMYVALDSSTVDFHGPTSLPDGRGILAFQHRRDGANAIVIVEGSPPRARSVYADSTGDVVSYSPTGHLLSMREDTDYSSSIWAVPFSLASRKATGPAFLVLHGAEFAVASAGGTLIALEGQPPPLRQLVLKRRDTGAEVPLGDPLRGVTQPVFSPDGGRIAYSAVAEDNADVWVVDLARGTRTRLTTARESEGNAVWSPDGKRVFFSSVGGVGHSRIISVASDGSGSPDTVGAGIQVTLSPDGTSFVSTMDRRGNADLWITWLDHRGPPKPFLDSASSESDPGISPDGQWIVYVSNESGQSEVYVRRYPEGDERAQVSVGGGRWPSWNRRGDAIYYVSHDTLTTVSIRPGAPPALGLPHPLFPASAEGLDLSGRVYGGTPVNEHPDGLRYVVVRRTGAPAERALLLVENWFEEFRKR